VPGLFKGKEEVLELNIHIRLHVYSGEVTLLREKNNKIIAC
jgi:hypothetical protein